MSSAVAVTGLRDAESSVQSFLLSLPKYTFALQEVPSLLQPFFNDRTMFSSFSNVTEYWISAMQEGHDNCWSTMRTASQDEPRPGELPCAAVQASLLPFIVCCCIAVGTVIFPLLVAVLPCKLCYRMRTWRWRRDIYSSRQFTKEKREQSRDISMDGNGIQQSTKVLNGDGDILSSNSSPKILHGPGRDIDIDVDHSDAKTARIKLCSSVLISALLVMFSFVLVITAIVSSSKISNTVDKASAQYSMLNEELIAAATRLPPRLSHDSIILAARLQEVQNIVSEQSELIRTQLVYATQLSQTMEPLVANLTEKVANITNPSISCTSCPAGYPNIQCAGCESGQYVNASRYSVQRLQLSSAVQPNPSLFTFGEAALHILKNYSSDHDDQQWEVFKSSVTWTKKEISDSMALVSEFLSREAQWVVATGSVVCCMLLFLILTIALQIFAIQSRRSDSIKPFFKASHLLYMLLWTSSIFLCWMLSGALIPLSLLAGEVCSRVPHAVSQTSEDMNAFLQWSNWTGTSQKSSALTFETFLEDCISPLNDNDDGQGFLFASAGVNTSRSLNLALQMTPDRQNTLIKTNTLPWEYFQSQLNVSKSASNASGLVAFISPADAFSSLGWAQQFGALTSLNDEDCCFFFGNTTMSTCSGCSTVARSALLRLQPFDAVMGQAMDALNMLTSSAHNTINAVNLAYDRLRDFRNQISDLNDAYVADAQSRNSAYVEDMQCPAFSKRNVNEAYHLLCQNGGGYEILLRLTGCILMLAVVTQYLPVFVGMTYVQCAYLRDHGLQAWQPAHSDLLRAFGKRILLFPKRKKRHTADFSDPHTSLTTVNHSDVESELGDSVSIAQSSQQSLVEFGSNQINVRDLTTGKTISHEDLHVGSLSNPYMFAAKRLAVEKATGVGSHSSMGIGSLRESPLPSPVSLAGTGRSGSMSQALVSTKGASTMSFHDLTAVKSQSYVKHVQGSAPVSSFNMTAAQLGSSVQNEVAQHEGLDVFSESSVSDTEDPSSRGCSDAEKEESIIPERPYRAEMDLVLNHSQEQQSSPRRFSLAMSSLGTSAHRAWRRGSVDNRSQSAVALRKAATVRASGNSQFASKLLREEFKSRRASISSSKSANSGRSWLSGNESEPRGDLGDQTTSQIDCFTDDGGSSAVQSQSDGGEEDFHSAPAPLSRGRTLSLADLANSSMSIEAVAAHAAVIDSRLQPGTSGTIKNAQVSESKGSIFDRAKGTSHHSSGQSEQKLGSAMPGSNTLLRSRSRMRRPSVINIIKEQTKRHNVNVSSSFLSR